LIVLGESFFFDSLRYLVLRRRVMGIYIIRFRLHLIWKVFNIYICVDFDRAIIEIGFFLYIYEMFIVEWLVKIIVPGYSIITSSFLARIQTEFERNREAKNLNRKMVICYSLAMRCDWVCWILGVLQCNIFIKYTYFYY